MPPSGRVEKRILNYVGALFIFTLLLRCVYVHFSCPVIVGLGNNFVFSRVSCKRIGCIWYVLQHVRPPVCFHTLQYIFADLLVLTHSLLFHLLQIQPIRCTYLIKTCCKTLFKYNSHAVATQYIHPNAANTYSELKHEERCVVLCTVLEVEIMPHQL